MNYGILIYNKMKSWILGISNRSFLLFFFGGGEMFLHCWCALYCKLLFLMGLSYSVSFSVYMKKCVQRYVHTFLKHVPEVWTIFVRNIKGPLKSKPSWRVTGGCGASRSCRLSVYLPSGLSAYRLIGCCGTGCRWKPSWRVTRGRGSQLVCRVVYRLISLSAYWLLCCCGVGSRWKRNFYMDACPTGRSADFKYCELSSTFLHCGRQYICT